MYFHFVDKKLTTNFSNLLQLKANKMIKYC
jgi:hypothetical protein